MREDKRKITQKMMEYLKICRCGYDIVDMLYDSDIYGNELVLIYFEEEAEPVRVNITGDSGGAMMKDVLRVLL